MERKASVSRILLVDDHDLSVRHALTILNTPKHEVRIALSADEAVDLALSWLPDLLFVDLYLDGLEGIAIIRKIRRGWPTATPLPKIVVLTADRSRLDRVEAEQLRIDRVLVKPVSGRQLRDCVFDSGRGPVNENGDRGHSAELRQMFREELEDRLPELDRCMAGLERDRIPHILHQLIASAAIAGDTGFESALRALDGKCRRGGTSEEIAFCYHAVLQSASRWRSEDRSRT